MANIIVNDDSISVDGVYASFDGGISIYAQDFQDVAGLVYPTFESLVPPAVLVALYADDMSVSPNGIVMDDVGNTFSLGGEDLIVAMLYMAAQLRAEQAALSLGYSLRMVCADDDDVWF